MENAENTDQLALRKWITAGLQIPEVKDLYGDAGYLLSNMIAKYTLAASMYRLSERAHEWFLGNKIDLSGEYARSRFYGKSGPFMYEHSIPASVIRSALLQIEPTAQNVAEILAKSGFVVVVLRSEDDQLRSHGLARAMPSSWNFGDDPYARYQAAGISLSDAYLKVKGKIQR
jgi:hypothetical protein